MRILYDHQIFCRQSYGGVSRYFYEISQQIPKIAGDYCEVFSPAYVNHYLQSNPTPGFRILRLPRFRGSAYALGFVNTPLGFFLHSPRKDIDIFHQTYYSRSVYKPRGAKDVLTIYDMIHELFPDSFSDSGFISRSKVAAVKRADHIICISESTQRDLIKLFDVPREKTSVVYLGHSLSSPYVQRNAKSAPCEQPYLLYVGNRAGYKNFECLISAYSDSRFLKDEFKILCFGGGSLTRTEASTLKRLGISQSSVICLAGSDARLSALYSSAAALIYPSLYEGFGIPPLEAMAHSCPVICANTGSLPEVVGRAAALFNPLDPDELRSKIETIVCSGECSSKLVIRGLERIKNFTWDRCARDTLHVYQKLADQRD